MAPCGGKLSGLSGTLVSPLQGPLFSVNPNTNQAVPTPAGLLFNANTTSLVNSSTLSASANTIYCLWLVRRGAQARGQFVRVRFDELGLVDQRVGSRPSGDALTPLPTEYYRNTKYCNAPAYIEVSSLLLSLNL